MSLRSLSPLLASPRLASRPRLLCTRTRDVTRTNNAGHTHATMSAVKKYDYIGEEGGRWTSMRQTGTERPDPTGERETAAGQQRAGTAGAHTNSCRRHSLHPCLVWLLSSSPSASSLLPLLLVLFQFLARSASARSWSSPRRARPRWSRRVPPPTSRRTRTRDSSRTVRRGEWEGGEWCARWCRCPARASTGSRLVFEAPALPHRSLACSPHHRSTVVNLGCLCDDVRPR